MSSSSASHPKGLYLLYFTEMWERFSYYGMRAIFTLYMVNALLFDKAVASQIYGSYTGLVYLTPLLGGYIADRYWGNRKSIIVGGALMAIGQFFMFMSGSLYNSAETSTMVMFVGLGFLILGNGFFKPNISTMVGQLYPPNDRRVDSAFTIFYQGINLGAFIAPIICGGLGEQYTEAGAVLPGAFKWGFLAACIGMIISLITFVILKNKYVVTPDGEAVGMPPKQAYNRKDDISTEKTKISPAKIGITLAAEALLFILFNQVLTFDVIGSAIFSLCLVLPAFIISEPSLSKIEKDRILVIYIVAFFVIFFWMAFEQAGASLTFFAQEQTDRHIFGWNMPASMFQIFNALFIVALAPVAVAIWGALGKRGKEPASPVKQSMGLGFLAIGYLFIAWGVYGVQPWDKVSMFWLVGLYLIHTVGELCLSPIGLSMVVKLAPARFVSLLMGVWFMSTATANKFAGELSALYPEEVKMETTANADASILSMVKNQAIDTAVWNMSAKEVSKLQVADLVLDDKKENVTSLQLTSASKDVSVYHLKLIKILNSKLEKAVVSSDGKYLINSKTDTKKTKDGEVTSEKLEVWNLQPTKPSFLGMQINNLFDFFMIFVYMAGAAAIILFAINKWLLKKMHGVV
jgi:proton-dependent oligopeptide transporter, POT family